MASILNNSKGRFSLAYNVGGEVRVLKVSPGINTLGSFRAEGVNEWLSSETDFENAVMCVSELDYVKNLEDRSLLVLNYKPRIDLREETPKKKKHKDKGFGEF